MRNWRFDSVFLLYNLHDLWPLPAVRIFHLSKPVTLVIILSYWLCAVDLEMSVSSEWIIINPLQYGFYRVNYPTSNWNAIIHQLDTNHTVSHGIYWQPPYLQVRIGIHDCVHLTGYRSTEQGSTHQWRVQPGQVSEHLSSSGSVATLEFCLHNCTLLSVLVD